MDSVKGQTTIGSGQLGICSLDIVLCLVSHTKAACGDDRSSLAAQLLSGDVVHLRANWEAKRVPSINFDRELSLRSMQEMDALLKQTGARLWINHDFEQAQTIKKAPLYFE